MADRYYLVKLETNAPEHKLHQVDAVFAKEVRLQFGSAAAIYMINELPELDTMLLFGMEQVPDKDPHNWEHDVEG